MNWIYLVLAILTEVAGTVSLKMSHGFSRVVPVVLTIGLYGCSLAALAYALKKIEIGMAYAIWSALGTALIAVIGIVWFKEPANALKLISLALIVTGVFFLKLSTQAG